MTSEFTTLEKTSDNVAILRIDRPKANALSPELLEELHEHARVLVLEPPGAVVIWGGEKIFAAGADIARFGGANEALSIGGLFHRSLNAIASIPRPTIAAIAGYALGGGCELALACDFRVASPQAKLGQPEILLGIIPGGGGTQRLARLVGPARAKDLIFSGRHVEVEEAFRIGLIDRIAPSNESLFSTAYEWARELAQGPSIALGLAKQAVDFGLDGNLKDGLDLELRLFSESFSTNDAAIGIKSFLERGPGKATFTGS